MRKIILHIDYMYMYHSKKGCARISYYTFLSFEFLNDFEFLIIFTKHTISTSHCYNNTKHNNGKNILNKLQNEKKLWA